MDDATVTVRVPAELAFLLRPRDRPARERRLGFDADATVGHVVRAAGVPLTEVGALWLDGVPTRAAARPRAGALVEVAAVPRPQPVPSGGFLLDVGLGALARRLRLLGLDAAWSNDAEDADLAARAAAEERVLLTQDRGLLMRRGVRGALVRGSRPDDQLARRPRPVPPRAGPADPLHRLRRPPRAGAEGRGRRPAAAGHPPHVRRVLPLPGVRAALLARRARPPDRRARGHRPA